MTGGFTPQHTPALRAWQRFLRAEGHVLRERPGLLLQEAFHQAPGSVVERAAHAAWARGGERPLWLARRGGGEGDPCLLVLAGQSRLGFAGCAISPDGALLAAAGRDGSLQLWDAATGVEVWRVAGDEQTGVGRWPPPRACAFSPDGRLLLSTGPRGALAWSADGAWIATGATEEGLMVWSTATGEPIASVADTGRITSCRLSPDGALLATLSHEGPLRLWSTAGWREVDLQRGEEVHTCCDFLPDGSALVAGTERGEILRLSLDPPAPPVRVATLDDAVLDCAVSPEGGLVAATDGAARVYDLASGALLHTLRAPGRRVLRCVFAGGERWLATGSAEPGEVQNAAGGRWHGLRAGGQAVALWDLDSAVAVAEFPTGAAVTALAAVTADLVAAGDGAGRCHLLRAVGIDLGLPAAIRAGHDLRCPWCRAPQPPPAPGAQAVAECGICHRPFRGIH